jgi:hypothetical protein
MERGADDEGAEDEPPVELIVGALAAATGNATLSGC